MKIEKFLSMNIKSKLKIAIFFICFICLIVSVAIYFSFSDYQYSLQKATIAQRIALTVFEERFLADEYVLTHSERAKSQWISKQNGFESELDAYDKIFQDSQKEIYLFSSIYDNVVKNSDVFDQLIKIDSLKSADFSPDLARQNELRLSSQLLVNSQNSISAAADLADMNNKNVADSFQRIIILFSASSLLLFLALFAVFVIIWRSASELYKRKIKDEAILNGIGDGVVAIDRAWNIILFNKAASSISGWSQSEAMGKSFRSVVRFIRESDRKENIDFIERAMVFGKVGFMENHTVLIKKDNSEVPIGDSAAPLVDENGQIVGAIIIFRDVSYERELHALRSDFAYASHQLRTPINKALWNLEIMKGSGDLAAIKDSANIAYMALKSISKISGQLVEMSEIDKGTIIVQPDFVKLADVVDGVIDRVASDAKIRNVSIETSPMLASEGIDTDSRLLEKILYEIIINAIIYNKDGGTVKVNVSAHGKDTLFEVRDSGIGIPADQQALIFTKFFRGSNFDTTNIIGGGLGLFTAREYVKLLKGKIWFESGDPGGTVFYVLLPTVLKIE